MIKRSAFVILFLAIVTLSDAYKYIYSIEVDIPSGQIYVGESNTGSTVLYELDNVAVSQNAAHYLPYPSSDALFVMKRGNKRSLYTVQESPAGNTELAYFKVPIGNQLTLPVQAKGIIGDKYLSDSPIFDATDRVGVFPVSRNLTLVNLDNLKVLDSLYYYIGSRIFGKNLVYNRQNNHLISFTTKISVGNSKYGPSVDEFDLTTGKFVEVPTTYNCMCQQPEYDPLTSPFLRAVFANCDIDYTVSPAQIWCADPDNSKLFRFQADNLSIFNVISTGATTFTSVAWDFPNKRAYAIYADDTSSTGGFSVHKINMNNGNTISTISDSEVTIDGAVFRLDPAEPHLYISVSNYEDTQPTQIVFINTDSFTSHTIVTLNTNGL